MKNEDRQNESKRILQRVTRESDMAGTSVFARTAMRARKHLAAHDAANGDWAELWGTRIARILSVIAFAVLALWLYRLLTR